MDTLRRPSPLREAAFDRFLPPESGLSMEPSGSTSSRRREDPAPLQIRLLFRRLFIFAGTALLTMAGSYEMYEVVKVGGVTVLEAILLAFFVPLLAWVAFSFMSAMAGFFVWSLAVMTGCSLIAMALFRVVTAHRYAIADL